MGYVTDYLQSTRMAQDLAKLMGSTVADDLEYVNRELTCALLRWQQWFENDYIDREEVGLHQPGYIDFSNYRVNILHILSKRDISEEKIQPKINDVLIESAQKLLKPGADWQERFVKLLTMGACEYHGFNQVFADSIKKHGLNPDAKFHSGKQIEPILKIFERVGQPTGMGNVRHDQNLICVTPDPLVAHLHAKISPEWFYFFSMGSQTVNTAYINRDYTEARNNLLKFPKKENLTPDECGKIIEFFEYWWKKLANPSSQKIAVMPMFRDKAVLHNRIDFNLKFLKKFGYKRTINNLLNSNMYVDYEHIYNQAIDPKFIQIIDLPSKDNHSQRLSQLQDVFQQTHLALEQQSEIIAGFNVRGIKPNSTEQEPIK